MAHDEPTRGSGGTRTAGKKAVSPVRAGEIPDKLYFRIGDVSEICDVPAYVLRFWETEFPQLHPNKGGTGQRLYRRRDVEMALKIKRLLYDEGYTIPGARQLLKTEQKQPAPQLTLPGTPAADLRALQGLRRELQSILTLLSRPPGTKAAPQPFRTQRRAPGLESSRRTPARPEPLTESLFSFPPSTEG